jgi:hypothetical protein
MSVMNSRRRMGFLKAKEQRLNIAGGSCGVHYSKISVLMTGLGLGRFKTFCRANARRSHPVLGHGVLLVFGAPCQIRHWRGRSTAGPFH